MVPYGGIEPTTSQFVAECSVRYTNRAFEIGASGGSCNLTLFRLKGGYPSTVVSEALKLFFLLLKVGVSEWQFGHNNLKFDFSLFE